MLNKELLRRDGQTAMQKISILFYAEVDMYQNYIFTK